MLIEQSKNYFRLMRFNKPIGIFLLLWPALWALWFASHGKPDYQVLSVFVAGVILMRAAGCIVNDLADRHIDGQVERTRARPLASKKITPLAAIILFCLLVAAAFMLVLMLNRLTVWLAVVGMLLTMTYPFMKRFTHLPQVGLGAAFAWSVPMAFAAETNHVPFSAWILFFITLLWPVIYDTMYAMIDRVDDLKAGVKSTAILFGKNDRKIIAILQILFLFGLSIVGLIFNMRTPFYVGLACAAGLFVYQQKLIKERLPSQCLQAFLNNNWVGLLIFSGILWSYAG